MNEMLQGEKTIKINLKPHNIKAYNEAKEMLNGDNRAAIVQATGTGKSYVIMQFIYDYSNEDKLIIAPSVDIIKQYKANEYWQDRSIKCITYSKLSRMYKENELNSKTLGNVKLIVADELHRTGAESWGEAFKFLIKIFPNAKILGATATPIRYLDDNRDMVEELFHGNYASNLDINEAIIKKILPQPTYITSLYSIKDDIKKRVNAANKMKKYNNESVTKELLDRLNKLSLQWESKSGVDKIIEKHLKSQVNEAGGVKIIVFCSNVNSLDYYTKEIKEWFSNAFKTKQINIYKYHSKELKHDKQFEEFKKKEISSGINILMTIAKLNEGIHLNDVSAIMMLRKTISNIIYQQQIGRVLSISNSYHPIIFDLVNNCNEVGSGLNFWNNINNNIKSDREYKKKNKCIEIYDYTKDIINILGEIDDRISTPIESTMSLIREALSKGEDINNLQDKKMQTMVRLILSQNRTMNIYEDYANELRELGAIEKVIIPWTEEEDEIIKKYYPIEAGKTALRLHNRTSSGVHSRAKLLGVKFEPWTKEEDNILINYYPIEGLKVSKRFAQKKTKSQICNRAHTLALKVTNGMKPWSEEELKILKKYYSQEGNNVIYRLKGRSELSIRQKAKELKLEMPPRRNIWTKEEDAILVKYYVEEGSDVIKRLKNRTKSSIDNRVKILKLTKDSSWSQEEDKLLMELYPTLGSKIYKQFKNRTQVAVAKRAISLGIKYQIKVWSKKEEEILKSYFPIEGYNVINRLDDKTKEQVRKKATKLGLR